MTTSLAKRESALLASGAAAEMAALETALGGRDALTGHLLLAPLTPDLAALIGLLGDPTHRGKSLAAIMAQTNILPGDVLRYVAAAGMARGKALAAVEVGKRIPAVVRDILEKAAPYEGTCTGPCAGTGSYTPNPTTEEPNPTPSPCPVCKGGGVLIYQPAFEHQKLAVELAHLLPKGGGMQILNQQINAASGAAGGAGDGALEQLQHATDAILYGGAPVVEAEVVDPESPP